MRDSNKQIKLGALISYFAIAFNIVAGLIYTPWMVASIGQNNYGLYTMANSLISMFLIDFGISAAVTRFVSKYNAGNEQENINNFLGLVYKLYLIVDAIICIVLVAAFVFLDVIYVKLTAEELQNFKTLYIIVGVYSVATFPFVTLNGILNAYEEFVIVKLCEMANKILSIVLTVLVIVSGYGVRALVLMQAVSGIITLVLRFWAVKKKTPVKVNFVYRNKEMLKDIFGFSIWSTVTSVSQRFIINIVPSLIGALTGAGEVAIFGVAITIEGYYYTFANAINGFFMPKISRILHDDEKEENLLELMIRVGRIQIYVLGLILLGFIVVGSEFVVLWMGTAYQRAYICAILLILPSFIAWPQQIATTALIVENKMKQQAIINVLTSIISIVIGFILIIFFGTIGAAISICIAYTFRVVCINVIYVKYLKINLKRFFAETFLKQGKYLLMVLIMALVICNVIPGLGWTYFLLKSGLVCGCYAIVMYFFSFNESEKGFLKIAIKKIIRRFHS